VGIHYKWQFSIAMLVHQRVILMVHGSWSCSHDSPWFPIVPPFKNGHFALSQRSPSAVRRCTPRPVWGTSISPQQRGRHGKIGGFHPILTVDTPFLWSRWCGNSLQKTMVSKVFNVGGKGLTSPWHGVYHEHLGKYGISPPKIWDFWKWDAIEFKDLPIKKCVP